ncbi:MAG: DUF5698 domain-containing protein [Anaerolineaceae bacterium]|nr:DUF5698 domain-containing protein [Anaerolineaceae bacterium]
MAEFFATANPWLVAGVIFIVRVLNMAVDTIRMLTVMRGMRTITWILGVIQTVLYVIALGSVINNLDNPINILSYSVGFATGNVVGMMIEKRLAFGYINMTIISSVRGQELADRLRMGGHAVTEIPARGKDGTVEILECSVQRKYAPGVQELVMQIDPAAFITSRDIQPLHRGYWRE